MVYGKRGLSEHDEIACHGGCGEFFETCQLNERGLCEDCESVRKQNENEKLLDWQDIAQSYMEGASQ